VPRYYFRITGGNAYHDDTGEELRDDAEAWYVTKRLTRDIEDTLKPGSYWQLEVEDANQIVYRVTITSEKLR
jgi:hypothetical protein